MHEFNMVSFEKPYLGTRHIIADDNKYSLKEVSFYQNVTGLWANTKDVRLSITPEFTQCILRGKINLFETQKISYNSGLNNGYSNPITGMYSHPTHIQPMGNPTKTFRYYYNKGLGELKKANYKNLATDLADNPISMEHFTAYKAKNQAQIGLAIAGTVIAAGCLIGLANNGSHIKSNTPPLVIGALVGGGAIIGSYFIYLSKPKHLHKAIWEYNK